MPCTLVDKPVTGITYLAESSHICEKLRPYDWYLRMVVAGARHHNFPIPYVRALERTPVWEDRDAQRVARMEQTLVLLE